MAKEVGDLSDAPSRSALPPGGPLGPRARLPVTVALALLAAACGAGGTSGGAEADPNRGLDTTASSAPASPLPVVTPRSRSSAMPTRATLRTRTIPQLGTWDPAWVAHDVALDPAGDLAYVAGGHDGFSVVDLRDPERPREIASLADLDGPPRALEDARQRRAWLRVAAQHRRAFLSGWNTILWIDLSAPARPRRRDALACCGTFMAWAPIALGPGRLYASEVLDSDLASFPLDEPAGFGEGQAIALRGRWADGAADDERLVLAQGGGGLDIVDLRDPAAPRAQPRYEDQGDAERVALDGSTAYVVGGDVAGLRGLSVLDLSEPERPVVVARRGPDLDLGREGPRLLHGALDVATGAGRLALLSTFDGREHLLELLDPRDPDAEAPLGTLRLRGQGAAGEPRVDLAGDLAAVALGEQGLRIVDVSTPRAPRLLGAIEAVAAVYDVAVAGDLALAIAGEHGLRVLDVADPRVPRELGSFDPVAPVRCVAVQGALAATCAGDLRLLDLGEPARPVEIGRWAPPEAATWTSERPLRAVALRDGLAFLSGAGADLRVLDLAEPARPRELGRLEGQGQGGPIQLRDDLAFVAAGWGGLVIVDVADPARPVELGRYRPESWRLDVDRPDLVRAAVDVWVDGDLALVASEEDGLHVLDVSDPGQPVLRRRFEPLPVHNRHAPVVHAVLGDGERVVIASGYGVLEVYDIDELLGPEPAGGRPIRPLRQLMMEGANRRFTVEGQHLYVAGSLAGLRILDRAAVFEGTDASEPGREQGR